jgi:membrane-associated PAP2 superfamily phosphatase
MSRLALVLVLAVAVVVGLVFGLWPRLDLDISARFFDPAAGGFKVNAQPWVMFSRDVARGLITLLAAPAIFALVGKLILPRRPMLIAGRAAVLIVATLALGPGLLANTLLKDHWGRARPIDVVELGGTDRFTPWWDPRGPCPNNCSFIAGEPSGAFWTFAPAALAPPQWRALAYGGALAFGTGVGLLRIAAGAHFLTDVVFAGVFMFLLVWVAHGLLFRWPTRRPGDAMFERPLTAAGEAIRGAWLMVARWIGARPEKRL